VTDPAAIPARPDDPNGTRSTAVVLLVLIAPAAFVVPFLGPVAATIVTVVLAATLGDTVWPVRKGITALAGVLVVVVIVLVFAIGAAAGMGNVVAFQLIPLCGPDPGTVWIVAALAGVVGYGLLAAISVRRGVIWLWPVAAAAGAGLYLVTWAVTARALDVTWIC
jgi:hypothetical protein